MQEINFKESIEGEVYPITTSCIGFGQLGFWTQRAPQIVPNLNIRVYPLTITKTGMFRWRTTKLSRGGFIISCFRFDTYEYYLLGHDLIGKNLEIFIEDSPMPRYEEQILPRNLFTLEFIVDSPLFFHIRSNHKTFMSAGVTTSMRPDPSFLVSCFLNEESKKYAYFKDYCSWYLALNTEHTSPNALRGYANLKPFDALTKTFGKPINESFLKKLTTI